MNIIIFCVALLAVGVQCRPEECSEDVESGHCIGITSYKAYQDIIESTKGMLVVVKVEAAGCRGCEWLAPGLEELAEKYAGQVLILTVDYMVVPEIMWEFKCPKIPTLIIYKHGVVIDQFVSTDKNVVEERIQKALTDDE